MYNYITYTFVDMLFQYIFSKTPGRLFSSATEKIPMPSLPTDVETSTGHEKPQ